MGQVLKELSLGPPSGKLRYNLDNYIYIYIYIKDPYKEGGSRIARKRERERERERVIVLLHKNKCKPSPQTKAEEHY